MKITKRQLKQIIKEELEDVLAAEDLETFEPVQDAWAGSEDDANLALPLDHSEAQGNSPVVSAVEDVTLDIVGEWWRK